MNTEANIAETNTEVANTEVAAQVTVTETVKTPRDKCKRAHALYLQELPKLDAMGKRAWRSHVLNLLQAELPCTLSASVAHYNNSRIALGGERRVLGPRKNKAQTGDSTPASPAADGVAAAPTADSDVWCVERVGGAKTWHIGEEAARAVAAELGESQVANVYLDNDSVEA